MAVLGNPSKMGLDTAAYYSTSGVLNSEFDEFNPKEKTNWH